LQSSIHQSTSEEKNRKVVFLKSIIEKDIKWEQWLKSSDSKENERIKMSQRHPH